MAGRGQQWEQELVDAEDLRAAIGRLVRATRGSVEGLPANQAAALGHLARDGAMPITELARRERVRHQSMARTVSLLADSGLVRVGQDPADGRRAVVEASPAGLEQLREQRVARSAELAEAIRRALPDAERGQVRKTVELLDRLAEAMDEGSVP